MTQPEVVCWFSGVIKKRGKWWCAECGDLGAFTQGRSLLECMANLAEVVELRVDRHGFKALVECVQTDPSKPVRIVRIGGNYPAMLALAAQRYQFSRWVQAG